MQINIILRENDKRDMKEETKEKTKASLHQVEEIEFWNCEKASMSSSSRERKRAALYEKLRAATNSTAMNRASIIVDASKYIEELKQKVDTLNQLNQIDVEAEGSSSPAQQVSVETLEKGFLINVLSEKNCPGLLVSILEAFDELGLDVLDARVSCADNFQLEAIGGENIGEADSIDAQVVKQAVLQAIQNWSQTD